MSKTIQLKDREIQFNFNEVDSLDLKSILTINYADLKDDIQNFPFVVNQLNFLVVEADSILNQDEFQLELLNSNLEEEKAKLFLKIKKELIDSGEKNPTISLIENQIKLEESYKSISEAIPCQKQKIIEDKKNKGYLSGLYWAAQAKLNLLVGFSGSKNVF